MNFVEVIKITEPIDVVIITFENRQIKIFSSDRTSFHPKKLNEIIL